MNSKEMQRKPDQAIIVKLLKRITKAKGKRLITLEASTVRLTANLSAETMEARRQLDDIVTVYKGNLCSKIKVKI